jgi:hypothetical protein
MYVMCLMRRGGLFDLLRISPAPEIARLRLDRPIIARGINEYKRRAALHTYIAGIDGAGNLFIIGTFDDGARIRENG